MSVRAQRRREGARDVAIWTRPGKSVHYRPVGVRPSVGDRPGGPTCQKQDVIAIMGRAIVAQSGGPTTVTDAFGDYLRPLVAGEAAIEIGPDGLPVFVRLAKRMVAKRTGREYALE